MRILIVSGIFHPEVGGPATYLHALSHALTRAGHEVGVIAYGDSEAATYPFPVWRVSRRGHPVLRLLRFIRALLAVSARYPVWYVNDYGLPAAVVSLARRPKIVMKIVGDFAWEYSRRHGLTRDGIDAFQRTRYGARIRMVKALQRLYVRRAGCVIVPSRYLAGIVAGWGIPEHRIRVIYNAVELPECIAPVQDERVDGARVVLTAARLAPWKGIDHLLRAIAEASRGVPSIRLVIAGDGPLRSELQELAGRLGVEHRVVWLGSVNRDDLLRWMARADLFALLSEYEGFSHVLLEAMSMGVPVLASPAGGNAELVRPGQDGILVAPDDLQAVAGALVRVLTHDSWRSSLAAGARSRAAQYSWPRLLDETLEVLTHSDARLRER